MAEKMRDGEIGQAMAHREQRVQVASADATAVEGENVAKVTIANSDADRREREAEANRRAVAAEKVTDAQALQEAYAAEKLAEQVRADRDKATQTANIVVPAEIDKQKVEINAEAIAEQTRRIAKGEADAIFMKMAAEGKGIYEILSKQAEGFDHLVKAAGNDAQKAVLMMIADKLPELVRTQVEAIKNIKIDKVTVWETGNGKDGKTSTANFMQGMLGSIPPLDDIFKSAGMELPNYLKGQVKEEIVAERSKTKKEEPEDLK